MAATKGSTDGPDHRREQMLQAAVSVMCQRGFSETRISDVAKATDSSPALVIYYFGTKDGLLTEAIRYSEAEFYAATATRLGTLASARDRLEALVQVTCVKHCDGEEPFAWGLWFDLWVQAFRHPEVAKDRVEFDRRWSSTIATVVREGQESGEFGAADVEEFCIAFAALLDGLSIQVALDDEVVTSERAVSVAMRFAAGSLGFIWPPPKAPRRRGAAKPAPLPTTS